MTINIEDVVKKIAEWQGKTIEVFTLSGGLTNTNYKVVVNGTPFFVRIPGESTELLAVDRINEYENSKAAATTGVAPKVIHYLPEYQVMVLEFIEGKTMNNELLNQPGQPQRIAHSLKILHKGPRFYKDFNMFRLIEFYMDIVKSNDIRIPEGYTDRLPTIKRIERAFSVNPLATVPCHNDLLAENYIDDGQLLRIVDFEYSGNNDPCFELGNTCQELQYSDQQIYELCEAYFGEATPPKLARMKLNMIMSDMGWTLWAAIQAKISKIEYDFWGWAIERWERAVAKMDSDVFENWLLDVQQTDK